MYYGADNQGILIPGIPTRQMRATYEEDIPNPPDNWNLGVTNPEPGVTDTAFTLTKFVSIAQCKFYTPPATDVAGVSFPAPYSGQQTYGTKSDYLDVVLEPSVQTGGASVLVEFQGAMGIDVAQQRTAPNLSLPYTQFTPNIHACDGFPYIRWRITMRASSDQLYLAKLGKVSVPLIQAP
jgi:hypothetical protein